MPTPSEIEKVRNILKGVGISAPGADQVVGGNLVTDANNRQKLLALLVEVLVYPLGRTGMDGGGGHGGGGPHK